MTFRTALLHAAAETIDPGCGAPHYALGLARAFEAHLTALVLELDVATPKGVQGGQRNARAAADALGNAAREIGVATSVITERSHIHSTPEIAADHARLTDIAIAGVHGDGLLSERLVAESLIFQSGRPVIIVPVDHRASFRADRIVVAWDFSAFAARALSDALPLLRRASAVTLVSFGDDKDFASSLSPDQVLVALGRRDIEASHRRVERGNRDIGEAINAAASECGADLLVMGGRGHSRIRDFILGGATRSILARPALPTLISH